MIHALTVDVEDACNVILRDRLGQDVPPTRAVVDNTRRLLNLLANHRTRATFFCLGEVADAYPELIREIAAGGHELGAHGYSHRQVFKLSPDQFRQEVGAAKARIEDVSGTPVFGHRAAAFSIMPETRWAFDVLAEAGFRYDSSVFPVRARRYGWPGFPAGIHRIELDSGRSLVEVPLTTVTVLGRRWPACGGGYLRHFPGFVTRWAMRRVERQRPAVVYLHPYEIETDPPPFDLSPLTFAQAAGFRLNWWLQLRNRGTVEAKLTSLLRTFQFSPLIEIVERTSAASR